MESDNIQKSRKWIPSWLSIPLVVLVAFIIMMVFFNENSYMKSIEYNSQINTLKQKIQENLDSTKYYTGKVNELHTNRETLEKIAREQYNMQRENEDVYITDIK